MRKPLPDVANVHPAQAMIEQQEQRIATVSDQQRGPQVEGFRVKGLGQPKGRASMSCFPASVTPRHEEEKHKQGRALPLRFSDLRRGHHHVDMYFGPEG